MGEEQDPLDPWRKPSDWSSEDESADDDWLIQLFLNNLPTDAFPVDPEFHESSRNSIAIYFRDRYLRSLNHPDRLPSLDFAELTRLFQLQCTVSHLNSLVTELEELGIIRPVEEEAYGRPVRAWTFVPDAPLPESLIADIEWNDRATAAVDRGEELPPRRT